MHHKIFIMSWNAATTTANWIAVNSISDGRRTAASDGVSYIKAIATAIEEHNNINIQHGPVAFCRMKWRGKPEDDWVATSTTTDPTEKEEMCSSSDRVIGRQSTRRISNGLIEPKVDGGRS